MKISFLGTGGGRFATISQRRMTGGFRIDDFDGRNFHIDPGPGALVRSYQFGLSPVALDGVFISHAHTDHYTDGEVLIEAMTRGMTKENGLIMGSRSVFDGYKTWGPAISKYHTGKSQKLLLAPNKTKIIDNIKIKGTKTIHGDPTCVGFQMKSKDLTVSYTSDTSYFEKLYKYHKGADVLIASVIRPGNQSIKGHMCTGDFKNLINEVKPKIAIMTHFGFKMLNEDPEKEAKLIHDETLIPTIAAFDGMKIDIDSENIADFKVSTVKMDCGPNKDYNNIFHKGNRRPYNNKRNTRKFKDNSSNVMEAPLNVRNVSLDD